MTVTVAATLAACSDLGGDGAGSPTGTATNAAGCGAGQTAEKVRGTVVCVASADADQDGTPDAFEDVLLQRYRPYYRFSVDDGDETFTPTDVLWYLARADLITGGEENGSEVVRSHETLARHPEQVLTADHSDRGIYHLGLADLTRNPRRTDWHINPLGDDSRHGPGWDVVTRSHNTGLYGHVVELRRGEFQVEYWQFFGYSSVNRAFDVADHEGDWTTVQLTVQPGDAEHELLSVAHYAHGYPMTFHFPSRTSRDPVAVPGGT
ncbi:MAG TPA: hypothetical protein VFE14_04950, partial [Micromonosporaceae bacterium]|nr:hypothetical protein [Micromonosporaceae bacterium]